MIELEKCNGNLDPKLLAHEYTKTTESCHGINRDPNVLAYWPWRMFLLGVK